MPDLTDHPVQERLAAALGPKFEVAGLLGRGGFAEVYEVLDRQLHRRLAVKVLRPDMAWTQGMLQRFEQEARALARLSHPNILPIHFVGDAEGLVYYAMPFVVGQSLGDILRAETMLPPDRAVAIVRPILLALAHAHQRGMIHRDIKPDNIIIEQETGRPLLVDFGIAKEMDDAVNTTQSGFVVGTPTYMSPEQALGQANVDHRSDLYALGGVLFHMVTGLPPFPGDTSQEVIGKHISQPVPRPAVINDKVPRWLSAVIVKSLAKYPDDRYQSAADMAEALREGMQSGPRPSISTAALVDRIREDDPTAIMPAAEGELPEPDAAYQRRRSGPAAEPARRASDEFRRPSRAGGVLLGFSILVAAVSLVAYFALIPLRFSLRNRLAVPVRVAWSVGGPGAETLVAPGAALTRPLPEDGRIVAGWSLLRSSLTDGGAELGVPLGGTIRSDGPSVLQTLRRRVIADIDRFGTGGERYFAPLITNQTGQPVRVEVNPGLAGPHCDCLVPPGSRIRIGYYQAADESMVKVAATGRYAVYRDISRGIDPASGAVEIVVDSAGLGL